MYCPRCKKRVKKEDCYTTMQGERHNCKFGVSSSVYENKKQYEALKRINKQIIKKRRK